MNTKINYNDNEISEIYPTHQYEYPIEELIAKTMKPCILMPDQIDNALPGNNTHDSDLISPPSPITDHDSDLMTPPAPITDIDMIG